MSSTKNIAILGAGRICCALGYHLARVGHDITVVARGRRLDALVAAQALVDVSGQRSPATIAAALDPTIDFDAVIVTVLAHQLEEALPAIGSSRAKKVIFMLNTFEPLERLREAVGHARAVFAFPVIIADFEGDLLKSQVDHPGQGVTIEDHEWAEVFAHAHVPATIEHDMQSWLRAHAAVVVPLMAAGRLVQGRGGLSFGEAKLHARALDEGFGVVRALGHPVIPRAVAAIGLLPTTAKAGILWSMSRMPVVRSLGEKGPEEVRALLDAMIAAAPGGTPTDALAAIRP